MFGGVYGKLSEERTWQQPCRNLVLFYPNVGPGKRFNEVSWPGPISFPLVSHDFQYPLFPLLCLPRFSCPGGGMRLRNGGSLSSLCSFSSQLPMAYPALCGAQPFLGHLFLRLSGDQYAAGGQNQDTQLPVWGCHLCGFGSAPFM